KAAGIGWSAISVAVEFVGAKRVNFQKPVPEVNRNLPDAHNPGIDAERLSRLRRGTAVRRQSALCEIGNLLRACRHHQRDYLLGKGTSLDTPDLPGRAEP